MVKATAEKNLLRKGPGTMSTRPRELSGPWSGHNSRSPYISKLKVTSDSSHRIFTPQYIPCFLERKILYDVYFYR
jgi:hypothetical protein